MVLEIGPGTGQATRRLLERGADPLVALEPDPALAAYLSGDWTGQPVDVRVEALEDAALRADAFDLAVAASSFHWVEDDARTGDSSSRCAAARRLVGDVVDSLREKAVTPTRSSSHEPDPSMRDLAASPTCGVEGRSAHALDPEARLSALAAAGFEDAEHEVDSLERRVGRGGHPRAVRTFSPIARLEAERREGILDEVERIADDDFDGRCRARIRTSLYTARSPPAAGRTLSA